MAVIVFGLPIIYQFIVCQRCADEEQKIQYLLPTVLEFKA